MRKTIYLPDDLAAQVDEYLKLHDGETLSSLIQRVVKREVAPKDPSALLNLVGLVKSGTPRSVVPADERQPEDRYTGQ